MAKAVPVILFANTDHEITMAVDMYVMPSTTQYKYLLGQPWLGAHEVHAWACTYYGELRVRPDIGYQEKSFTDKYGEGRELRLPLDMHGQKPCGQARRSESTEERGVYTLYPGGSEATTSPPPPTASSCQATAGGEGDGAEHPHMQQSPDAAGSSKGAGSTIAPSYPALQAAASPLEMEPVMQLGLLNHEKGPMTLPPLGEQQLKSDTEPHEQLAATAAAMPVSASEESKGSREVLAAPHIVSEHATTEKGQPAPASAPPSSAAPTSAAAPSGAPVHGMPSVPPIMSPTTCSKQLLMGSITAVPRPMQGGGTNDKRRSSDDDDDDDDDNMRVSWTPAQSARYGSNSHMATAVRGLHQPASRDGYVASNMGATPRSAPPSDSNYVTKEKNSSTYHYMRDPGAALNMPLVQERYINRPMQGDVSANTKEKSTAASYVPPHIRLRLGQEKAAATTSMSLPEGMAAKPRAARLHEDSKHKDYGDQDSRSQRVMTMAPY
jgi:hypothetical protein